MSAYVAETGWSAASARRIVETAQQMDRLVVECGIGGSSPPPPAPVNTTPPVITGDVRLGQPLTATSGVWDHAPTSYSYQWTRDHAPVAGETTNTYIPSDAADISSELRCEVTATNAAGSSAPAPSNSLASVWRNAYLQDATVWIWEAGDGLSMSIGAPVDEWRTVDGAALLSQATSASRPTREATYIEYDGADDFLLNDSLSARADGAFSYYAGFDDQINDSVTGERSLFTAAASSSGGNTLQSRLSYSRPDTPNATRMRALDAAINLSAYAPGANGLNLAININSFSNTNEVFEFTHPRVSLGTATRHASVSHSWFTLGARRVGMAAAIANYWRGRLRYFIVGSRQYDATEMEILRQCAIAAGVM